MSPHEQTATRERHGPALVDGEFPLTAEDFGRIAALVREEAGIDLPDRKAMLVYSRLCKRVSATGLGSFSEYCNLVAADRGRDERAAMCAALTTNVTRFNREPHHLDHLEREALPALVRRVKRGGRLRLWSAACSSGEEPYSIALSVLALLPDAPSHDVRILATDINPAVLASGRRGLYDLTALDPIRAETRHRWFKPAGPNTCETVPALRALVSFRVLNLVAEWPMRGRFDAIFCRNVAIYFDAETQARLWSRLSDILLPGGWLYIGHSERLSGPALDKMEPAGLTTYRKRGGRGE